MSDTKLRFECVHCGWCCVSPNLLVTITHFDIYCLTNLFESLEKIKEKTAFYIPEKLTETIKKAMYVPAILTSKGLAYLALLKKTTGECIFYDSTGNRCAIYPYRPLACRTFPFTFDYNPETKKMKISFTKGSKGICKGVHKGPQISSDHLRKLGVYKTKIIRDFEFVCKEINHSAQKETILSAQEILWVLKTYAEKKAKQDGIGIEI